MNVNRDKMKIEGGNRERDEERREKKVNTGMLKVREERLKEETERERD